MNHKGHKVLGHFCWDCQLNTRAGVPGWKHISKNQAPKLDYGTTSVVWADGSYDENKECSECHSHVCKFPVHTDSYKVLISTVAKERGN